MQQACFLFFTNNFHTGGEPYYNRLILSDSERTRIEHIRKGYLRHMVCLYACVHIGAHCW